MQNNTIITINREGIIQSCDENCFFIFGYICEDLIGKSIKYIMASPYKEQHDSYFMKTYANSMQPKLIGKGRIIEGKNKEGEIFPIKMSISSVGGGELYIVMIDKILDNSLAITINSDGVIVSCNQNVEPILGFQTSQIIGTSLLQIISKSFVNISHFDNKKFLEYLINKKYKVRNFTAIGRGGIHFPVSFQIDEMNIGGIKLYKCIINRVDSMEVVFTLDDDGNIISSNQYFILPLLGYTPQEIIGMNITDLFIKKKNEEYFELDMKRRKSINSDWKNSGIHFIECLHKDGSIFSAELAIYHFTPGDGRLLYSAIITRKDNNESIPIFSISNNEEIPSYSSRRGSISVSPNLTEIGDYQLIKTVTQGSYGKVQLAYHKITKQKVAIKILQKTRMNEPELERARRETKILDQLDHPYIAKLIEVIETDESMNIIMEYCGRTLLSYILEKNGLGENDSKKFFAQILSAVQYCHNKNIIHRDIKHENILLDDKDNCKLIDFGLSNFMEEGKLRATFCGTPAYAAPEMILGKKYMGPEVDVWSLGVVLYSMIAGVFPFQNVGDIISGNFANIPNISNECKNLIENMLKIDLKERITLDKVIHHPWIQKETNELSILINYPNIKTITPLQIISTITTI